MIATQTTETRGDRRGHALPLVLFALVLLGVLGSASLQTTRDDLMSATAIRGSNAAFYAAEAGLSTAMANWDQDAIDTLLTTSGDSLVSSWSTLANSCEYQTVFRRVDQQDTVTYKLYSITSTGRSPGMSSGQRRVGMMWRVFVGLPGIAFDNDLEISGNATITGACAGVHSNGALNLAGNPVIGGDVSTSDTVLVGGNPVDTLGNPITVTEGAPIVGFPDVVSTDYCGDADFIFTNAGIGTKVATPENHDFSDGNPYWGWKWVSGTNSWLTDSNTPEQGVYCVDGNVQIGHNMGAPGNPAEFTFLATGSLEMSGDPYITPAHPDSILIIAEGDLKLNGSASGGNENYGGLTYAGAQCEMSGTPSLFGQLVCKNNANPAGSADWVAENKISGNMTLTYNCGGIFAPNRAEAISNRAWTQVW